MQHDAHIQRAGCKTDDKKIVMLLCPSPKAVIDEEHVLPYGDNATHSVSSVYDSSHFAVLYYDLYECTVTVFDGLNMDLRKWENTLSIPSRHMVSSH